MRLVGFLLFAAGTIAVYRLILCWGLPLCLNESSLHHSFSPVTFDPLDSGGVQLPNANLTWAETGWRRATLRNLKSLSNDATTAEFFRHSARGRR